MRSPARTTALFSTLALLHPSASTPVQLPTLPHSLARRDNTAVSCGTWATANAGDAGRGLGSNGDDAVFVAAGACGRVGCYDTSGVYVCNDQSDDLAFGMDEVVAQVAWLKEVCGEHGAVSGQVFSEEHGGYNVNVGFCDSGDPVTKGPGEYVRVSSSWGGGMVG